MALPADLQNKGLKTAHANTQRFSFNKDFAQECVDCVCSVAEDVISKNNNNNK